MKLKQWWSTILLTSTKRTVTSHHHSQNINKANSHLSSSLTEHQKRPRHMTLEIHILVWDRPKWCGLIVNWSRPSFFDNLISNGNTYIAHIWCLCHLYFKPYVMLKSLHAIQISLYYIFSCTKSKIVKGISIQQHSWNTSTH